MTCRAGAAGSASLNPHLRQPVAQSVAAEAQQPRQLKSLDNGYTLGEVAGSSGFDWNEANILHIARHDVTPDEAEEVFWNPPVLMRMGKGRGELRFVLLGETDGGRCLVVI